MSDDKPKLTRTKIGKEIVAAAMAAQAGPAKGAPKEKQSSFLDRINGTETWSDQIDRARRAAAEMERATELLNQTLVAAEKQFTELGLGVATSIRLWIDEEDGEEQRLVFGKDGKDWRLSVSTGHVDEPPWEYVSSNLMSSSRETRARAVDVLPELFEALVKEAESRANHLNGQLRRANDFLGQLRNK